VVIVEYILDPQDKPRSYNPKTIPSFITDGGHFFNPDGSEKMIGILEGSIPDGVTTFTLAELQARQRAVHADYPMKKYNHDIVDPLLKDDMTNDEVDAMVKAWWDERS
jgi:hypothetical protein